jgi:hypothetical protein
VTCPALKPLGLPPEVKEASIALGRGGMPNGKESDHARIYQKKDIKEEGDDGYL